MTPAGLHRLFGASADPAAAIREAVTRARLEAWRSLETDEERVAFVRCTRSADGLDLLARRRFLSNAVRQEIEDQRAALALVDAVAGDGRYGVAEVHRALAGEPTTLRPPTDALLRQILRARAGARARARALVERAGLAPSEEARP